MLNYFRKISRLNKKYLVSVIIPNYNNEQFLDECLSSVLNQSLKNVEIVVCDDYSSDSSREILEIYYHKYSNIKIIYNDKNLGVSKTRHKAIIGSSGKYITTLDSDDYYVSVDKLKDEVSLVGHYKKNTGKDIIAFSNVDVVNAAGKRISSYQGGRVREGYLLDLILSRQCMIPRDFMFLKKLYFDVGGFDLSINLYEDWDLKIRMAAEYNFYYTGKLGVAYRRKGHGLSYESKEELINSMEYVFSKNINLVKDIEKRKEINVQFDRYISRIKDR